MNTHTHSNVRLNFRSPFQKIAEPIRYAIDKYEMGFIAVARSEKGICAIFLADDPDDLFLQLEKAFPKNELEKWPLASEVAAVVKYLQHPQLNSIELDVCGTDFQQKVWKEIVGIPLGEKTTYQRIAQDIGSPNAVRAVARACAANVFAVAIPCHRVVTTAGGLAGYRWGMERKRLLLQREGSL
jgi:AraC family transcriptional regulator of adaptative response/methylated-DNA-[protein]-cysteine methyltransferase